jgi:hypothetical protein
VQPVLATASDTVSTLTHDVAAAAAPVEAVVQPVLATASDTVSTLTHDVAAAAAPVEAVVQPALATASDAVSTPTQDVSHLVADGSAGSDTVASVAPVADITASHAIDGASLSDPAADLLHAATGDTGSSNTSTGNVSGPADTLLAAANATHTPIEVPESATAAPTNIGTGAPPASAAPDQIATAGDVIALPDASPPANALYSGTQYTQYGVALSSDTTSPSQHAASQADTTAAHDSSAPVVADVQHQTQQQAPPLLPDIVDTSHQSTAHLGLVDSIL